MPKCTLIITEKPDAAERIASAIAATGKVRRLTDKGVPYYIPEMEETTIVVPALGHLYTLTSVKRGRDTYPVFDFKWVPRYLAERGAAKIRTWIDVISKLSESSDTFIDACDYDIEGSIIGYCILKYACKSKEKTAKRMKYSTLTQEEIRKSYNQPLPSLNFALIEAGLTRHEVDWLYGVNLSRALTIAVKNCTGDYATLSTGRVQGPTLKFIESREKKIRCFVPTPYWTIEAKVDINNSIFEIEYKDSIETEAEGEAILARSKKKEGAIEKIDVNEFQQKPPRPFDLGSLQSEAYLLFRYTPMQTLKISQRLYLDALISYPRTASQKLPPSIGYGNILRKLSKRVEYEKIAGELLAQSLLKPTQGNMEDPAHPAIYPTGELPKRFLDGNEKNILDLVVRRFLAVFGEPAIQESMKITISIGGNEFRLNGRRTIQKGWFHFYKPYVHHQDVLLPSIKQGQKIDVKKVLLQKMYTKPVSRYNPASLLRKMEEENIGTKATRAGIVQTLYDRKYIREERVTITNMGLEVAEILTKHCAPIASIELTRKLEERMYEIQQGNETRENTLKDAINALGQVTTELKKNEKTLCVNLGKAIREAKLEERTVGICPKCQNGKLVILHSKKTGKRFVGCTNYFENICEAAFPLPQSGKVKPSGKTCRSCGWPVVRVWMKKKRIWNLCLNPDCPLKKQVK
jgi:DNA topoisomerase-1